MHDDKSTTNERYGVVNLDTGEIIYEFDPSKTSQGFVKLYQGALKEERRRKRLQPIDWDVLLYLMEITSYNNFVYATQTHIANEIGRSRERTFRGRYPSWSRSVG